MQARRAARRKRPNAARAPHPSSLPATGERGRGERNVAPDIDRRKVRISVTVNWKGAASLRLPACGEKVRAGEGGARSKTKPTATAPKVPPPRRTVAGGCVLRDGNAQATVIAEHVFEMLGRPVPGVIGAFGIVLAHGDVFGGRKRH